MSSFVCQLCGKEFKSVNGLAAHISNKNSKCYMPAKEYYDRFLRKSGEGICKHCGKETMFVSLSKGYHSDICKKCKNKDPEIIKRQKEARDATYEERKVRSGYYQYPEVCELCGKRFKTRQGLAKHICQSHKDISVQEYYDRFLREDETEGICPITGKKTRFISLVEGYTKYYGKGTNSKSDEVKKKKEETLQKNFGVSNPVVLRYK